MRKVYRDRVVCESDLDRVTVDNVDNDIIIYPIKRSSGNQNKLQAPTTLSEKHKYELNISNFVPKHP